MEAEEKLNRLYTMVEEGVTELGDILRERNAALRAERVRTQTALERVRPQVSANTIAPATLERFGQEMREKNSSGDIGFRKTYLRSVIDQIEVADDVVRIVGDKATLEQAIAGNVGVRSFARNGAPEEIRTPDPQIRSLVLYPAELRARMPMFGNAVRSGRKRRFS